MNIKWYGHSSFLLTAENGLRIFTDPCDPDTGYTLHDIEADIVTMSHQHSDHNYLKAILGTPVVLREAVSRYQLKRTAGGFAGMDQISPEVLKMLRNMSRQDKG